MQTWMQMTPPITKAKIKKMKDPIACIDFAISKIVGDDSVISKV